MLTKYSVSWLLWGLIASYQLPEFSCAASYALSLAVGTSLFALIALGSRLKSKTKFRLTQHNVLQLSVKFLHLVKVSLTLSLLSRVLIG